MSCLAGKIFHSHNKILLSRDENNLLIDHSKFLKIFCDLYMYCSGSCDASVTSNTISRDVEERLRLMLTLADPAIILDLRTNNGFNGTKFNAFWDELEAYFNEQV